jgi:hypothetical protein
MIPIFLCTADVYKLGESWNILVLEVGEKLSGML